MQYSVTKEPENKTHLFVFQVCVIDVEKLGVTFRLRCQHFEIKARKIMG